MGRGREDSRKESERMAGIEIKEKGQKQKKRKGKETNERVERKKIEKKEREKQLMGRDWKTRWKEGCLFELCKWR